MADANLELFELATSELWNKIGFHKKQEDWISKVIKAAKEAMSESFGVQNTRIQRRRDQAILKNKTIYITTLVPFVPQAGQVRDNFLTTFKAKYRIQMMECSEPCVDVQMTEEEVVLNVKFPGSVTLRFQLTVNPQDLNRQEDDRRKFSFKGLQALACIQDVVTRNPVWNANIPAEMVKNMVVQRDVNNHSKGFILRQIMLPLSNLVLVPGELAFLGANIRELIANRAQEFLDNPALFVTD